jgi:Tfp pilus assembly protein PilX
VKPRDEAGQALILALAFLLIIGLGVGAMVSFAASSMLSTGQLRTQRSTVYAADGAVDAAIQAGRYDASIGAFGASPCMHSSSFTNAEPDGPTATVTATVTCAGTSDPFTSDRTVTFTATYGGVTVLVAKAIYHDGAVGGIPPIPVDVVRWTYCGHDATAC